MRRLVFGVYIALTAGCAVKNTRSASPPPPVAGAASSPQPAPPNPPAPPAADVKPSTPATPAGAAVKPPGISIPSFPARLEAETDAEKKLDGSLLRIVRAARSGGAPNAEAAAKALDLLGEDNRIKAEIIAANTGQAPAIGEAVAKSGGSVLTVLENHVFALLPPAVIADFASRPDVFAIASVVSNIHK